MLTAIFLPTLLEAGFSACTGDTPLPPQAANIAIMAIRIVSFGILILLSAVLASWLVKYIIPII